MTPLRQRMIEDMQLRGFSARTQEAYVHAVRQLAEHLHKPPDRISEEELRQYFLYLINVKHFARASFTIALCGIKFFFESTLDRTWTLFGLARPQREKKLPSSSVARRFAASWVAFAFPSTAPVSSRFMPAACGSSKEPVSPSPTSRATACSCTFTAREAATAMSPCPAPPSLACANTGWRTHRSSL